MERYGVINYPDGNKYYEGFVRESDGTQLPKVWNLFFRGWRRSFFWGGQCKICGRINEDRTDNTRKT